MSDTITIAVSDLPRLVTAIIDAERDGPGQNADLVEVVMQFAIPGLDD